MKIDSNTLLLIGAAAVGVYLLTRPKTTYPVGYSPYATGMPAYNPYGATALQQQSTTAQDIAAGGSALAQLATTVGNLFG